MMGNEASKATTYSGSMAARRVWAAALFSAAAVVLLLTTAPPASAFIPSMSAPSITAPAEGTYEPDGNFTLSGTAKFGTVSVKVVDTDAAGRYHVGTVRPDSSGRWSLNLSGVVLGKHSYRAVAYDAMGFASYWSNIRTVTVDTPQLFEKQDTNVQLAEQEWGKLTEEARQMNLSPEAQQAIAEMAKLTQSIEQHSQFVAQIPVGSTSADELKQMEDELQALQNRMDTISNSQQMDMLRLQTIGPKLEQPLSLMSNIMKNQHDIMTSIIFSNLS